MYVDVVLDDIVAFAVSQGVSDIHFDPAKTDMRIRLRQDGMMRLYRQMEQEDADLIINRIKVLSGMDISEKRIPQDGRWDWSGRGLYATMRVSSMPSLYGETVVCRIMGNEGSHKTLRELGMSDVMYERIRHLLQRPYGLLVVCGPTGSGKSATLYAMLRMLNLDISKLICLEDPVEADIDGAIQIGIHEKIGFTFSRGLRAVLRQDPDSIMIGEIRDNETAQLAVKAALTGHRVLSTIHTNTALGVISRLVDMGVERYLLEATLIGVVSQRLVRRLDPHDHTYAGRTALYEYHFTKAFSWDLHYHRL